MAAKKKREVKKDEAEVGYEPKPNEKLVTFTPSESFTGWPFGYSADTRKGVEFEAGVESIPVPESYRDLMKTKGFLAEKAAATPAAADA